MSQPLAQYRRRPGGMVLLVVAAILLGVVAVVTAAGVITGFDKTTGGEVAVVRNGGLLDNNSVRQVIQPSSDPTWTGFWSTSHKYPAQQRFYTITADPRRGDRAGVDVEYNPTADGVEVGIEGTIYFTLSTDQTALMGFDDKFGTRRYQGVDGQYRYAWEGDEGWSNFLDQIVRPVISNDLREQIGAFRCAELQAACALVQNSGDGQSVGLIAKDSNVNIAKIQNAINTSLQRHLAETLGGEFIVDVRFNLAKITLPPKVQDAIDSAQAAFAQVSEAQARVAQAKADAAANAQRQRGYEQCPACANIDTLKAIPPNVTTFAPGAGFSITPNG